MLGVVDLVTWVRVRVRVRVTDRDRDRVRVGVRVRVRANPKPSPNLELRQAEADGGGGGLGHVDVDEPVLVGDDHEALVLLRQLPRRRRLGGPRLPSPRLRLVGELLL